MLQIDALYAQLAKHRVLDGFALKIQPGLTAILGPNGSGKTSLLRALAGLLPVSTGRMQFGQLDLMQLSTQERARTISYLAQNTPLYWPLKVQALIAMARRSFREPVATTCEFVENAMQRCQVSHLAHRPINQLSGGERARVLLARALAANTDLLLVDEPIASLDPARQLAIMKILQAEARAGKTVLAVLHDLPLVARFCDQAVLMEQGKLINMDSPGALLKSKHMQHVFGLSFTANGNLRSSLT